MENNAKVTLKNAVGEIFPNAEEAIENAKEMSSSYIENAKAQGQKAWSHTKGFIQKNPVKAVGYAVLIGAILATYLYSKRQD